MTLHCQQWLVSLIVTIVGFLPLQAEEPMSPGKKRLPPQKLAAQWSRMVGKLSQREAFQLFSGLMNGNGIGPGAGWFHEGKSRYNWKTLTQRFDANGNKRIDPDEIPARFFQRLDRDGSGAITVSDLNWSSRSPYLRELGMAREWLYRIDKESNGQISREEWLQFFEKAAKGKEYLTPEDLRRALIARPPRPKVKGPAPRGPSPAMLVKGMLTGEIGSILEGPDINEKAPGFRLKLQNGKGTVRLAELRGKPVVLIFGSFT